MKIEAALINHSLMELEGGIIIIAVWPNGQP